MSPIANFRHQVGKSMRYIPSVRMLTCIDPTSKVFAVVRSGFHFQKKLRDLTLRDELPPSVFEFTIISGFMLYFWTEQLLMSKQDDYEKLSTALDKLAFSFDKFGESVETLSNIHHAEKQLARTLNAM